MIWLVIGLFSEGSTDSRFLPHIIYRHTLELILASGQQNVQLQEGIILFKERENADRVRRICRETTTVDIFIVHADAAVNARARILEKIIGDIQGLAYDTCKIESRRIVSLLPCREMEAWALVDPDAIARACGFYAWPESTSRNWNPERAESLDDPKATLLAAIAALHSRTRKRRPPQIGDILERIGTEVDLKQLGRTESFRIFSGALTKALQAKGALQV